MAKAIMIQGTMSNAGKSFLVAGLCRIFHQDGYKVAPFKSQNMALNSYITDDGLEMGRAQVMQAEACKIKPSVLMNPILLKPTSDMGSQVIVNGEVQGNMKAMDYFKQKRQLIPDIIKAYHTLDQEYDIIVIEGAGSPAEINLKSEDIVNMGMAKLAKAPVLLVGDIDRGGVFAQLLGTVILLEEDERNLIKGLVINKFRGDEKILEPGLAMLEEKCQIPVKGVVPYMQVDIDDEDSLSDKLNQNHVTAAIDIAVISLPHISNFTDFNSLEIRKDISVRYVKSSRELKNPDMIILPGTKNTINDLAWLRQSGLEASIMRQVGNGALLFGICGGYQMLGERISDPDGLEGGGIIQGMGFLPIGTIFSKEKTRTRVKGTILPLSSEYQLLSGSLIEGYEIHMGISRVISTSENEDNICSVVETYDIRNKSILRQDGICKANVCGTYIHGFFDTESVRDNLVRLLYNRKGIEPEKDTGISYKDYKEEQYDMMAAVLREHLNIKSIYDILEQGVDDRK